MIKNFIFDFGEVLVKFDTEYMTSRYIKNLDDVKLVEAVVFDRLYWDKLDEGSITDEEVKQGLRSRLPENLRKTLVWFMITGIKMFCLSTVCEMF